MRVLCAFLRLAIASAQPYRGEAAPVTSRTNPVEFVQVRFLTFVFGREG